MAQDNAAKVCINLAGQWASVMYAAHPKTRYKMD